MTDSEKLDLLLEHVTGISADVSKVNTKLENVEIRLLNLETDVSALKTDVSALKTDVLTLKADVSNLKTDMQSVQTKLSSLETDMTCVKLTLENEIRVNIQRVAEGHLDLSRNLKEATKPNEEFEWLSIRLRALETEVRNLKAIIE